MKVQDLIILSGRNLTRRKLRTFLTVLGVWIGTMSIVIMMSIAIGQSAYFYDMINQNNELTTITVYSGSDPHNGAIIDHNTDTDQSQALPPKTELTIESVKELSALEGASLVYPVLEKNVCFKTGPYENPYLQVAALPEEGLENLRLKYFDKSGTLKQLDVANFAVKEIEFLFGGDVKNNFFKKTGRGADFNLKKPIDPLHDLFVYFVDPDALADNNNNNNSNDNQEVPALVVKPQRRTAHIIGEIQKKNQFDYSTAFKVYTRLEPFVELLKKDFRGRGFEGQKKTKSGRWNGSINYSNIVVRTKSLEDSQHLLTVIKNMGYTPNSSASFINEIQQQQRRSQFMFGSIGAIALFVAAIGIANTMMMAVYERTKEIGVFKVLGCPIRQIRNMFLIEAGSIGFLGGAIGLVLSTLISFAINNLPSLTSVFTGDMMLNQDMAVRVSVIPLWLYAFALLFATGIGMLAGLFPALRAMKLSALEALRTE